MKLRHNYRTIAAFLIVAVVLVSAVVSCSSGNDNAVPRPKGYFRISPYTPEYTVFDGAPLGIQINKSAAVKITNNAATKDGSLWFDISYPRYNATVYCSYVPIEKKEFKAHMNNRMQRVMDNTRYGHPMCVTFEDTIHGIASHLFMASEKNVTPVQFIATDSTRFVYTGTLFMNGTMQPDSIAPVVNYITDDIMYMLQNLNPEIK